ncbi:MAG: type I glutamate--ammonia ligase [Candidatus Caldarchaeum sp.]|nr:type I glutamate--ammonia ligase [Candidatus Caldarchaeum sp.]MCX8200521.1 type I glutamate--ammonia ligase [Candidatus Caldarchaeum sp.]MDW8436017.1 type I glutamate--ammonia ligase [Candidatus Caldarchaeum sp.]
METAKPVEPKVAQVIDKIRRDNIRYVDLQLTDVPGKLHHITVLASQLTEDIFETGVAKLDGSSLRGFAEIYESDMVLKPDPSTFAVMPWATDDKKTARMICDVYKGYGGGRFSRDPRYVAQKAEEYLKTLGYDISYWGPEIEFFVFDRVHWDVKSPFEGVSYKIESREAAWNSSGTNYPIRFKEGYYPAPPQDTLMEYRNEVCRILTDYFGVEIEGHHHEVATAGQCEIDMRFDTLKRMGDKAQTYKYVSRVVANSMGMVATFMPKPIFGDNASGMHVHVSLWKDGVNTFYDETDEYAELSQTGRYFIGGLLEHSRALTAITNPSTNSYRRLVPGYEAPVFIAWSRANRSANVRVPVYYRGRAASKSKRIEFRTPDPSCNPYLCFAAMAAAGADGIRRKIDPGDPVNEDIYKLDPERRKQLGIRELPGSLREAVEELLSDREFLKPVFSDDLIDTITELQLKAFIDVTTKPHPYEFYLYFDV